VTVGVRNVGLKVLRHHGIFYLAVPDLGYTFDRDRAMTNLEYLIQDYTEGPEWSMQSHFGSFDCMV